MRSKNKVLLVKPFFLRKGLLQKGLRKQGLKQNFFPLHGKTFTKNACAKTF